MMREKTTQSEEFFTCPEASQYLKIPISTLYKLAARGEIPCVKIGKQLRFSKTSLHHWFTARENASLACRAQAADSVKENIALLPTSSRRILLIDDDALVLKSVAHLLQAYGYQVEQAASGNEALEKIQGIFPELVIADVKMPGLGGIETIKRIREFNRLNSRPAIPEIVITGYIDSASEKEAKDLGVADYLYKPFAATDVLKKISDIFK